MNQKEKEELESLKSAPEKIAEKEARLRELRDKELEEIKDTLHYIKEDVAEILGEIKK